ncbi:MAG: FAD binding domain-containing protein, partial [Syntrophales bacterium]|nr:FAD binding domain-containing protein [Syntrophales bacterium]
MRPVFLPATLDELWELLDTWPGAGLYAGGTDLLPALRRGEVDPPALICLERIAELQGVREEGDEIWIGAATTFRRILEAKVVVAHLPVLAAAVHTIGSPLIRSLGTIGGNIITASPAGDTL